jgi:hypothetical protein
MKTFKDYLNETEQLQAEPQLGDNVDIEIGFEDLIETYIVDVVEDGVVLQGDQATFQLLENIGCTFETIRRYGAVGSNNSTGYTNEDNTGLAQKAAELAPVSAMGIDIDEAEYQGREVSLNKPMQGDVKKSKVYVKNAKGNVVKVNFGDPNMKIKKSNPARRKSFRARHNCENPGPKTSARYWSCRAW